MFHFYPILLHAFLFNFFFVGLNNFSGSQCVFAKFVEIHATTIPCNALSLNEFQKFVKVYFLFLIQQFTKAEIIRPTIIILLSINKYITEEVLTRSRSKQNAITLCRRRNYKESVREIFGNSLSHTYSL